jgi:hypothetical protein
MDLDQRRKGEAMKTLLILYVANLILDYPLQGEFLAKYKAEKNYVLFVHSMIWAGGLSISLMLLGMFEWWKLAQLLIGHMLIDAWKCRGWYKKIGIKDRHSLYIDQALHATQVVICLL